MNKARDNERMTANTYPRKPLVEIFIALTMLTIIVMASNSRAQDGVADIGKVITVDFAILPSGVSVPPSFQIAGMTFFAHSSPDYSADPRIVDWGPPHERSYSFSEEGVTVVLPLEARAVEVRLCIGPGEVFVEAYSSTGILMTQERDITHPCHDLFLKGDSDSDLISIVRFTGGGNESSIARLSAILSTAPVVDAGEDQVVLAGQSVYLEGTAWDPHSGSTSDGGPLFCTTDYPTSFCPEPLFASFVWEQTGGREVLISPTDAPVAFTAPEVSVEETLSFRLTVTNYDGETGSDGVRVAVIPDPNP